MERLMPDPGAHDESPDVRRETLRPADVCRALLSALDAAEGRAGPAAR